MRRSTAFIFDHVWIASLMVLMLFVGKGLTLSGQDSSFVAIQPLQVQDPTPKQEKKHLPKLLDLGANKCKPCIMMAPILKQLQQDFHGKMEVEFVDVWQAENKERALKHKVESIPTQIFFDEQGKELWRHVGFFSREEILDKWKELGYEFHGSRD